MIRQRYAFLLALSVSLAMAGTEPKSQGPAYTDPSGKMPVTTSSAKARERFEIAMDDMEQARYNRSADDLRSAVKIDPKFAQAWILIARVSTDPEEQKDARTRAQQLAATVTEPEQLLIRWFSDAQENKLVPAIAAMNDLLEKYPKDQRLDFLAGDWLILQQRYEQAAKVLERAVALDPDYPAALNDLGYAYALTGNFEKAFGAMDRYVAVAGDQPNPHDSYGEILRMTGKFDAALQQYRMSIRIDPSFGSEVGVADTYALMGKEEEARDEYERAMVFAATPNDRLQYELQSAVTWIRENRRKEAEKALGQVAVDAHKAGLVRLEAEAHRVLALYEPDYKQTLKHLQAADEALQQKREISISDRDEEQARILQVRAEKAVEGGNMDAAAAAEKQLETMASSSPSQVIQLCYHAAEGTVLLARKEYSDAVSHLEEDSDDPLSMQLLWRAYSDTGATAQAQSLASKLSSLNVPTVEQALVVPQFRASLLSQARQP
jgi:tetratricopeptide (TPR) repeat protein